MVRPLPILMYHEFYSDIERDFDYIKSQGYTSVHLSEISDYLITPEQTPFPQKTIVLTFDDAYQDFFVSINPLLKTYNFKATVCVPTGYISESATCRRMSNWQNNNGWRQMMTWQELELLRDDGIEIISHSVSHIPLDQFDTDRSKLQHEIGCSKNMLKERLGVDNIHFFCLPGGAGWGKPLIENILRDEGYIGALRAQYDFDENWDANTIPRWQVSNIVDILRQW